MKDKKELKRYELREITDLKEICVRMIKNQNTCLSLLYLSAICLGLTVVMEEYRTSLTNLLIFLCTLSIFFWVNCRYWSIKYILLKK